jgi:hypothetical protein
MDTVKTNTQTKTNKPKKNKALKTIQRLKESPGFAEAQKKTKSNLKQALVASNIGWTGEAKNGIERIILTQTMPENSEPVRYSSPYTTLPTAVAPIYRTLPAPWLGTTTWSSTKQQLPATDMMAAVFRCPQRAAIVYDANPSNTNFQYQWYGCTDSVTVVNPTASFSTTVFNGQMKYLKTPYAVSLTPTYSPHETFQYALTDTSGRPRYIELESTTAVTCTVTGTASASVTMSLTLWTDDGPNENFIFQTQTLSAGTANFALTVPNRGYYAVAIYTANTGTYTVSALIYSCSSSVFRHLALPNLAANLASTDGIRISSMSIRYTNEASDLNKQGKIVGYQVPQGEHWDDYINNYQTVSGAPQAVQLPIDNGIYGYAKLTQPSDIDLNDYFLISNGVICDSFAPIDQKSAFLLVYAQVTTPAGQDGYFTLAYHLEYQTTDIWRTLGYPKYTTAMFDAAIESIKVLPQWYENPSHWENLWAKIKSVAGTVASGLVKYGPTVIKAATAVAPFL